MPKMKIKKKPPTKRRKPAVKKCGTAEPRSVITIEMEDGTATLLGMIDGEMNLKPYRGESIFILESAMTGKAVTYYGPDYAMGLFAINIRRFLSEYISRVNDTVVLTYQYVKGEKIVKKNKNVYKLIFDLESVRFDG